MTSVLIKEPCFECDGLGWRIIKSENARVKSVCVYCMGSGIEKEIECCFTEENYSHENSGTNSQ
jgi:hypothetical protein